MIHVSYWSSASRTAGNIILRAQRPPYLAKMEHLACYLPGNLALGVAEGAVKGAKGGRYMAAAKGLTETCWQMYAKQATGRRLPCHGAH